MVKPRVGLVTAERVRLAVPRKDRFIDKSTGRFGDTEGRGDKIARLFGRPVAESLANATEYEWHDDPQWDPFAELHGLVEHPK